MATSYLSVPYTVILREYGRFSEQDYRLGSKNFCCVRGLRIARTWHAIHTAHKCFINHQINGKFVKAAAMRTRSEAISNLFTLIVNPCFSWPIQVIDLARTQHPAATRLQLRIHFGQHVFCSHGSPPGLEIDDSLCTGKTWDCGIINASNKLDHFA